MNGGYMGRYLDVDLSSGAIETRPMNGDDQALYLGGRGMGVRMLYDLTVPGLDPYDERMVLIFSVGPLTGTNAPQSNRFVVTTKSPATGGIADSHCGGSVFVGTRNTDGSFMSFQIPSKPRLAKRATSPLHQARVGVRVKSGKWHTPGQTRPRTGLPRGSRTK